MFLVGIIGNWVCGNVSGWLYCWWWRCYDFSWWCVVYLGVNFGMFDCCEIGMWFCFVYCVFGWFYRDGLNYLWEW